MRFRRPVGWRRRVRSARAVLAAVAGSAVIAASLAACGPVPGSSAHGKTAAEASSGTTPDASLDSLPFGSVGGGFTPLAGGLVASVPVGAGQTVTVPVAGHGGVPASGADAVALAVAAAGGGVGGNVTVYPAGGGLPDVPSVSWAGRDAGSGLVVSGLSSGGAVAVHNSSARPVTVTLAADGYWRAGTPAAAGAFGPLTGGQVARVLVGGGQTVTVTVAGHGGMPVSGAGTVALSMAAASGFGAGSVTVYPAGARRHAAPGLSWAGGDAASGLVVSGLSSSGTVAVHNSSAWPVSVTLDADGYWLSGAPAAAGTFGATGGRRVARVLVGAGQTVPVPVAGLAGVPASGADAAALSVRTTSGPAAGSVTVYPASAALPDVPSLEWAAHRGVSGLVVSALSSSGTVAVHNSSARPVTVTLDADGYWLSTGRTVSNIVPKPTTVTLTGSDITAVSGDPAGTQTVTLTAGIPVPAVGQVLVASASATAPDGLLGMVTATADGTGGAHMVTLSPATLDQAYSTFNVSTSQVLTDSDIVQAPASSAGQTLTTDATPLSGTPLPAQDLADQTPRLDSNLSNAAFTCTGSGNPTITLTADLSKTKVDFTLITTDPLKPSIHFLITANPVFNINVGFTGALSCELADGQFLQAPIPIPGTPDLMVDLNPVFTLDADGQVSIDFQWDPRASFGFDEGPGLNMEAYGFGSSGSVGIKGTADADLFLGLSADVTLAGRIGVGGDLGPDLAASYDSSTGCVTVNGQLKADLTAHAYVFVKNWTFTLATGVFDTRQLYHACGAADTGTTPSPPPSSTSSAGTGNGSWTAAEASLPSDASAPQSGYLRASLGSVACPSASECVAGGTYAATSGLNGGLLLTGSGSSWSPFGAPDTSVSDVACPTALECVATEYVMNDLLIGSGSSWATQQVPLPANAGSNPTVYLDSVACPSVTTCVVAGSYTDSSGNQQGMLVTGSGTSWTATEIPLPSGGSFSTSSNGTNQTSGLSIMCASVSACVATGEYFDSSGNQESMLVTGSGSSWTATQMPVPAGGSDGQPSQGGSVACASASACVIVGTYTDSAGNTQDMFVTGSGTSWTATQMAVPTDPDVNNGLPSSGINGVTCPSASNCTAVVGFTGAGQQATVFNGLGSSWTATNVPLPISGGNNFDGGSIACASASACAVVVGSYQTSTNSSSVLILTGSGSSWTASSAPLPSSTAAIFGGACASASSCVAVGDYIDSDGSTEALLLTGPA